MHFIKILGESGDVHEEFITSKVLCEKGYSLGS